MVYYNLPRQTRGFRSLRFIRTPSFVSTGNSSLDVITSLVSIFFAVSSFSIIVKEIISIRFSFVFVENIVNLLLWQRCPACDIVVLSICSNSFQLCIRFYTVFEITIKYKVYIQGCSYWGLGGHVSPHPPPIP